MPRIEFSSYTLIPAEDSENVESKMEPLKNYLSKKLGMGVEIFVANDYTVDAGATSDTEYKTMMEKNLLPDVDIIHESAPIPTSPVAVRKDLDRGREINHDYYLASD
ncbi:PhnD/SsuA/transferrin family substrate-binding protein [Paenibacillus sp. NPDC056933]|uniref:PhnD/SsuA/transferrin family substrate-binding protein n=1 Tax=Paenibacillus sp. NPDC056933 TaxID=3345968 RepID=UPI00362C4D00